MEVHVKLLFFAKARELVQCEDTDVILSPTMTSKGIKDAILQKFPVLNPIANNFVLSLNQEYVEANEFVVQLKNGDEIAVIPPLSGG